MVYAGWGEAGLNAAARIDSIISSHQQLTKKPKAAFIAKAAFGFSVQFGFRPVLTGFRTIFGAFARFRCNCNDRKLLRRRIKT